MVRTGNVDFSCKRLTSIEIRKSKYHIIRRVRFWWDTPPTPPPPRPRKISGSALELDVCRHDYSKPPMILVTYLFPALNLIYMYLSLCVEPMCFMLFTTIFQ